MSMTFKTDVTSVQEGLTFKLAIFHPYDDVVSYLEDARMADITQCAWCGNLILHLESCCVPGAEAQALGSGIGFREFF